MLYNPYLVIPIIAWAVAQLIKFSLRAYSGRVDFKYLYASGGMPSGHAAVVCSLAVTALLLDGFASHLFGLTAILAAIVMYDSFGVRRSSGEQAVALNVLLDSLNKDRIPMTHQQRRLREVLGHSPLEVTIGAILGIGLAAAFNIDRLSAQVAWLTSEPFKVEQWVYIAVFAALVLAGLITRFIVSRVYRRSPAIKRLIRDLFIKTQVIGWVGLVLGFAQYEKASYLSWRLWSLVLIIILLIWDMFLISRYWSSLPAALAEERAEAKRRKWLPEPGKKKRRK